MDEHEWITSQQPGAMLDHLEKPSAATRVAHGMTTISELKKRLWVCAWWRDIEPHSADQEILVRGVEKEGVFRDSISRETKVSDLLLNCMTYHSGIAASGADLLREVVGNPFHPVRWLRDVRDIGLQGLDAWEKAGGNRWADTVLRCYRGTDVIRLAEAAYEERLDNRSLDPVRLAILADALEEAGCLERDMLQHLRGWTRCPRAFAPTGRESCPLCGIIDSVDHGWVRLPVKHVRGCWAVDLARGE
jgi:hypothetical protein